MCGISHTGRFKVPLTGAPRRGAFSATLTVALVSIQFVAFVFPLAKTQAEFGPTRCVTGSVIGSITGSATGSITGSISGSVTV